VGWYIWRRGWYGVPIIVMLYHGPFAFMCPVRQSDKLIKIVIVSAAYYTTDFIGFVTLEDA